MISDSCAFDGVAEKIGSKWFPLPRAVLTATHADLHLVVNWENDGRNVRIFAVRFGTQASTSDRG